MRQESDIYMIETAEDLTSLPMTCDRLYLDLETASVDPHKYAGSPYLGDKILGIALCVDDDPRCFYIPILHEHGKCVSIDEARFFIARLIKSCKAWINHNIKFDMHFINSEIVDLRYSAPEPLNIEFICTMTLMKIIDSDRIMKGGYGLDALSISILGEDINESYDRLQRYLHTYKIDKKKVVDYRYVPSDLMWPYACQDVKTCRKLYEWQHANLPSDCAKAWDIERRLTPVLFDIELRGMYVNVQDTKIEHFKTQVFLRVVEEKIHEMTGMSVLPHVSKDCERLLIAKYCLPIIEYTAAAEPKPSFTSDTLNKYLQFPQVKEDKTLESVIKLMIAYRDKHTLDNFFLSRYIEAADSNSLLHPDYNQLIQTGRMSCRNPNAQQLSKDAKLSIRPRPGYAFISIDYSQIEFRLIAHYIEQPAIIEAYVKDPMTDFHSWVAEITGMPRKAAKNVNFCIGYGGGKKKVLKMLSIDPNIIGDLSDQIDEEVKKGLVRQSDIQTVFQARCEKRAEDTYEKYHSTLSNLKATSNIAAHTTQARGYVRTAYGSRRYMPTKAAWRAFNSAVQGTAAYIIKDTTSRLAPRYNKSLADFDVHIVAQVHDENLFEAPIECLTNGKLPEIIGVIRSIMESPSIKLLVPIRVSIKTGVKSWAELDEYEDISTQVNMTRRTGDTQGGPDQTTNIFTNPGRPASSG